MHVNSGIQLSRVLDHDIHLSWIHFQVNSSIFIDSIPENEHGESYRSGLQSPCQMDMFDPQEMIFFIVSYHSWVSSSTSCMILKLQNKLR